MCHIATNTEIIQRALDHWNRTGEPLWSLYAEDLVYVTRPELTGGTEFEGHDGFRRALADFQQIWTVMRPEPGQVLEVEEDRLVATIHWHLRGHSGVEVEVDEFIATWMRGGRIARLEQYGTREEALAAFG